MMDITSQDFIAYKSAGDYIVTLKVPVGSRTNTCRKDVIDRDHAIFRTDKAHVLNIYHKDTGRSVDSVFSDHDPTFKYIVGEDVEPKEEYDPNPDEVSASGIHFFLIEAAAFDYNHAISDGIYREWYANGLLMRTWTNKNGLMHGAYVAYHSNGVCQVLCELDYGKEIGLSREWDEQGVLRHMSNRQNSTYIQYKKDGHTMIFTICDGEKSLKQAFWHENELTPEDKSDHAKQILKTGDLILSSDYKRLPDYFSGQLQPAYDHFYFIPLRTDIIH